MVGCINEYTSRRVNFELCYYWKRNDEEKDLSEYLLEEVPNGRFYAREITAFTNRKQEINNTFLFDETTITIETNDTIEAKVGDVVYFDDEVWVVLNIQRKHIHKNKQFLKADYNRTYLQLKR